MAYKSRITGKIVTNSLGNISQSNIIGYYDKRDRNLGPKAPPCRTTAFTSQQVDKWDKVKPLLFSIDKQFKNSILEICDSHNIESWEVGKIVKKDISKNNQFLPELIT